jgi:hypothetical protein
MRGDYHNSDCSVLRVEFVSAGHSLADVDGMKKKRK